MAGAHNLRKVYAIKAANEKRIKAICPEMTHESGIYIFSRVDEQGFKFAYAEQAIDLLERCASHLSGYQHIDLSLRKRGFCGAGNPHGWKLCCTYHGVSQLNIAEQDAIKCLADSGIQLYNSTSGSQGEGKKSLTDYGRGGYLKGKHEGAEKTLKTIGAEIAKYTQGLQSRGGAIADRKTAELRAKLQID